MTLVTRRCDGMVDVVDSKSTAGDSVPVRVRPPAPSKYSDLDTKSEYFFAYYRGRYINIVDGKQPIYSKTD